MAKGPEFGVSKCSGKCYDFKHITYSEVVYHLTIRRKRGIIPLFCYCEAGCGKKKRSGEDGLCIWYLWSTYEFLSTSISSFYPVLMMSPTRHLQRLAFWALPSHYRSTQNTAVEEYNNVCCSASCSMCYLIFKYQ